MQRYNKYQITIEILKHFKSLDRNNGINRYNILGGRAEGERGSLERQMDTTFADAERVLAGQVLIELQGRGLVVPTYRNTTSPGDWLRITPQGLNALKTGALDELDNLLLGLQSSYDLISMRYGAYDAITSQQRDWQRHAATSCRELITKVLHTIGPDDEVKNFVSNENSSGKIHRKARIRYYLKKKKNKISKKDLEVIERAGNLVEACYNKLCAISHTDIKEVEKVIKLTEDAIFFLLTS